MPKNDEPDFLARSQENICQLFLRSTGANRIELIMHYMMVQDNYQHGYDPQELKS